LSEGAILDDAITTRHPEIADFLLDHGADPSTPGVLGKSQTLYLAVKSGDVHLIEKVIAKGADVNENDYVGAGTPLIRAAMDNNVAIVKLLLDHGADPTAEAKFCGPALQVTSSPEIKKLLTEAIAGCQSGARKCESK
jgi:ankyrin repeat protein